MVLLCPRIHFYEINDQDWFPQYLREKVQSCLTLLWTIRVWPLQAAEPAQLAADTLYRTLGGRVWDYIYVDFAAGAGGPTPFIEQRLNARLTGSDDSKARQAGSSNSSSLRKVNAGSPKQTEGVRFVLTDLHPHIPEWTEAAKRSDNLSYVANPVDATDAPADLVGKDDGKVFRLYNLAFHHFDDDLASDILKNTLETADGFGIFELQGRTLSSMITVSAMGILLLLITPFYFWRSPGHLFFTYIIPIVPFVVVVDGYTSSVRTRTPQEIEALMRSCGANTNGWTIKSGEKVHTFPTGYMTWVLGTRS